MAFNPAQTGKARVFLIEGQARADHTPSYESCLALTGLDQSFGDVTKIECPDPDNYGKYIEIGEIRGSEERVTASLTGRYALELKSDLLRIARQRCAVDVQLHMGDCEDPRIFNDFKKAIILERVFLTNYSTDDLVSLASGDESEINETADLSAKEVYEVMPLAFAQRAGDLVTNEVVDIVVCGSPSCGDCTTEDDGCNKAYAITLGGGGSPSTPADVVFTLDKGETWYAHDIDSMDVGNNPDGVACVGDYLVIVSNDEGSLHYALLSEFDGSTDPDFTEISTGFVAGGEPNDISSLGTKAFIVGDGGYIYSTEDPTAGVTVLDAGVAVSDDLNAVDALSRTFAVAVGNAGAIVVTTDGDIWTEVTPSPVGVGINLTSVAVKNDDEWWIGTSDGRVFYTLDGGAAWTEKSFTGSGSGVVRDIVIATDSVMYISHDTTTPLGRILRSFNGGNSWVVLPEGSGSLPANDRFTALAACKHDANFVYGVGLADDASDGIIVVGQN